MTDLFATLCATGETEEGITFGKVSASLARVNRLTGNLPCLAINYGY